MLYAYNIVDVFSPAPFGGNQLAVLTDARGLTAEGMQAITREFNFAETTFVLPAEDPGCNRRVRIFTPGRELPFAGHPTIGTACALVMSGACPEGVITLQEGIGPVAVAVERRDGVLFGTLALERGPDLSDDVPTAPEIASLLGLAEADVAEVFGAGAGVNFTFARLADEAAVDRATLDRSAWQRLLADRWGAQLYIFSGQLDDGAELYARMFAPALGIVEDPATGAAAAALVGAAALRSPGGEGAEFRLRILQGVRMGRRSLLEAGARVDSGQVRTMRVGGAAAYVAEGRIDIPELYLER